MCRETPTTHARSKYELATSLAISQQTHFSKSNFQQIRCGLYLLPELRIDRLLLAASTKRDSLSAAFATSAKMRRPGPPRRFSLSVGSEKAVMDPSPPGGKNCRKSMLNKRNVLASHAKAPPGFKNGAQTRSARHRQP